jgi:hypothetical protein
MELIKGIFCPIHLSVYGCEAFCLLDNLMVYSERITARVRTHTHKQKQKLNTISNWFFIWATGNIYYLFHLVLTKGNNSFLIC